MKQEEMSSGVGTVLSRQIKVPTITQISDRKTSFFRAFDSDSIYNDGCAVRYSQDISGGTNCTVKSLHQNELKKLIHVKQQSEKEKHATLHA